MPWNYGLLKFQFQEPKCKVLNGTGINMNVVFEGKDRSLFEHWQTLVEKMTAYKRYSVRGMDVYGSYWTSRVKGDSLKMRSHLRWSSQKHLPLSELCWAPHLSWGTFSCPQSLRVQFLLRAKMTKAQGASGKKKCLHTNRKIRYYQW